MLLELGLPGTDGYEDAQRLRERAALPRDVLVAITGYADHAHRARGRDTSFAHYFVKPVDLDGMRELLDGYASGVGPGARLALGCKEEEVFPS